MAKSHYGAGAGAYGETVLLTGRPGSGKGTQAAYVAGLSGLLDISMGDLIRSAATQHTTRGRALSDLMDAGRLVPDAVVLALLGRELARVWPGRGILLDGFPRNLAQAQALETRRSVSLVVDLEVSTPLILDRLRRRARHDDTTDAITTRLDEYEVAIRPMHRWYSSRGLLVRVDGNDLPEVVGAQILTELSNSRSWMLQGATGS